MRRSTSLQKTPRDCRGCPHEAVQWPKAYGGGRMTAFDLTPPNENQRQEIAAGLNADERRVLLQHGTEAAFCGVFLDNKKEGTHTCRFCGLPLFRSNAKFDSGTGWPSFFKPYDEAHIKRDRKST